MATPPLILCDNLLLKSRVREQLRELGLEPESVSGDVAVSDDCPIVVVDLATRKYQPAAFIHRVRSEGFTGPILCFGPHVREDLFGAARSSGATEVIPNSVMSTRGARIIAQLIGKID